MVIMCDQSHKENKGHLPGASFSDDAKKFPDRLQFFLGEGFKMIELKQNNKMAEIKAIETNIKQRIIQATVH